MNIWKEYLLPVAPVVVVIGGLVAARMNRHRPFDSRRALSVCALCSCCFAGPFLRFGWDKAVVAFLFIFVMTAPIAIARWSEHCRYRSTLPAKDTTEKVPS